MPSPDGDKCTLVSVFVEKTQSLLSTNRSLLLEIFTQINGNFALPDWSLAGNRESEHLHEKRGRLSINFTAHTPPPLPYVRTLTSYINRSAQT